MSTWQREEKVKKCLVTHLSYLLPSSLGREVCPPGCQDRFFQGELVSADL